MTQCVYVEEFFDLDIAASLMGLLAVRLIRRDGISSGCHS